MSADNKAYVDDQDDDIVYEVGDQVQGEALLAPVVPGVMQSTPALALMALKITGQPWSQLGHGSDPNVAATSDMAITVERITSLFLIRIVAIISHRNQQQEKPSPDIQKFLDISTSNICSEALARKKPWSKPVTVTLIQQIRAFVRSILEKYNYVHYHSFEHAYHVTISFNKLLDMMLMNSSSIADVDTARSVSTSSSDSSVSKVSFAHRSIRKTYGLKHDPLVVFAALFSALVHDVEHQGLPNRQLVMESDELAILYNDQSVAEQRSLAVAFSELMREEFNGLREVVFETQDEYRRFRKTVINLVLATDIASPERTQLVKSKWKEAFGETYESKERKTRKEMSRRSVFSRAAKASKAPQGGSSVSLPTNLHGISEQSKPRAIYGTSSSSRPKRRGSGGVDSAAMNMSSASMMSELTIDPSIRFLSQMNNSLKRDDDGFHGDSLPNIHDDESDEESTSATPESNDGIDDLEEDDPPDATGMPAVSASHAAPPAIQVALNSSFASNGMHTAPTPIIRGKGRGKAESLQPDEVPPMPSMRRGQTDSFIPPPPSKLESSVSTESFLDPSNFRSYLRRRQSASDMSRGYSLRLSIRRSLDLTGEAIENYSVSSKTMGSSFTPKSSRTPSSEYTEGVDEPDELKATVVLEHFIRAADIGPTIQGWEQMEKWSNRLFFELQAAHTCGRGEDAQQHWFENQIIFLESYILPLARRLDDMGVFGATIGPMFANIVEQNKERWVMEGLSVTAQVVQEWHLMEEKSKVIGDL